MNLFLINEIGMMCVVFTHYVRKSKGTRENKQQFGIQKNGTELGSARVPNIG